MKLYTESETNSLSHLASPFPKELLNTSHPIAFKAHLNVTTIHLIFFLYENGKSFFPLNPALPDSQLELTLKETRSHFFDPEKREFIFNCKEPSYVESPSLLLHTSGTSSKPKVAVLPFESLLYSALGSAEFFGLGKEDCWQLNLPLFHVGGLLPLLRMKLSGGSLSLSKPLTFHEKATHGSFVPTQLFRYLKGECLGANSLKVILVGGASTNESLVQECKERCFPLYLTYGMTEMSSQITCGLYANGKVLPYRDLMIDSSGEIKVKGKSMFSGYLREDGTTHLPLDEKGYFSTRDIGSYDEEKGLVLLGRKDRQFISGGENIQPEEIEKVMKSLFSLTYCKVLPEPSLEYGMVGIAEMDPFPSLTHFEMKERLKKHLPPYKIPKRFEKQSQNLSLKESL